MKDNVATFNGRMGTGIFSFNVDRHRGSSFKVDVKNAQCEIDGGMENNNSIVIRSEEHTSELQSRINLVCRLLLEKKK